jgi:NADPH:quinone reductase-like Zn-dependent oxidoreductase
MKAVRYHEYGDPGVLRYEDVEQPVPGPGQVLVRVAGTSFNPLDAAIRAGYLRDNFPFPLPLTPGIDVSGTVARLGAGVEGLAVGDGVIGFLALDGGAAAEYALAPAAILATAPNAIPLADAAALPAVGITAWQAVFEHAELRAGQRILINGAGGAVGGYAVQLAKQAGAHVVAVASPRNADRMATYGAAEIVDRDATVTGPFDAILNFAPVDPGAMAALAALVAPGGLLLSTATPVPDGPGRTVQMYARSDAADLAALVHRVDGGELDVHVAERYPLDELATVHERSAAGKLTGKVVVTVGS